MEGLSPRLLRGPGDALHALAWGGSAPGTLRHLWLLDGTLQDEVVATAQAASSPGFAAVAGDGSLRGAWWFDGSMSVASNAGGAWSIDATSIPADARIAAIAVEPSGATQVLLWTPSGSELRVQGIDGAWTTIPLPTDFVLQGPVGLVAPADGASLLLYGAYIASGSWETWALDRDVAGWGTPVRAGSGAVSAVARSPGDGRMAVATSGATSHLLLRAGGVWRDVALGDGVEAPTLTTGFTADGRCWVLDGLFPDVYPPLGPPVVLYALYEE